MLPNEKKINGQELRSGRSKMESCRHDLHDISGQMDLEQVHLDDNFLEIIWKYILSSDNLFVEAAAGMSRGELGSIYWPSRDTEIQHLAPDPLADPIPNSMPTVGGHAAVWFTSPFRGDDFVLKRTRVGECLFYVWVAIGAKLFEVLRGLRCREFSESTTVLKAFQSRTASTEVPRSEPIDLNGAQPEPCGAFTLTELSCEIPIATLHSLQREFFLRISDLRPDSAFIPKCATDTPLAKQSDAIFYLRGPWIGGRQTVQIPSRLTTGRVQTTRQHPTIEGNIRSTTAPATVAAPVCAAGSQNGHDYERGTTQAKATQGNADSPPSVPAARKKPTLDELMHAFLGALPAAPRGAANLALVWFLFDALLPKCTGVDLRYTSSSLTENGIYVVPLLELQNVAARLKKPCLLDLKIGSKMYGADATEEKKEAMKAKALATTSAQYAVRLTSFQAYSAQAPSGSVFGSTSAPAIAAEWIGERPVELPRSLASSFKQLSEMENGIHSFFDTTLPQLRWKLADLFLQRTRKILAFFEAQRFLQVAGSSLLFFFDAISPLTTADIRLIDFAHASLNTDEPDTGYIRGLNVIIGIIERYLNCVNNVR